MFKIIIPNIYSPNQEPVPPAMPASVPSTNPAEPLKAQLNKKAVANRKYHKGKKKAADLANEVDPAKVLPPIKVEQLPVAGFKVTKRRIRKSNQPHIDEIARSIVENGFVVPILVAGDQIVDGHIRWEAAKSLKLETLPCIEVSHLDKDQRRMLAITLNKTAEGGEWCLPSVKLEMVELQNLGFDLSSTGFSPPELDLAMLDEPGEMDALNEAEPEPPKIPASILGDVWQLGDHRVCCGSATEKADYEKLLGTKTVQCVFTDPPYGCAIAGNVSGLGKVKHEDFIGGDAQMSDDELQGLFTDSLSLAAAALDEGRVVYSCIDWRKAHLMYSAGAAAGLTMINCVVWVKPGGGMGSFYRSAHEFIPVFCKGKTPKVNNVKLGKHGRNRTNVFEYAAANTPGSSANKMLAFHPTSKPIELVRDTLLDCTVRGDIVLDPFLGSGTTIIAADTCGRIGYGFELDPKYVDVIVRRWEQHTGKSAIHQETGKTFKALAKERGASWL